MMDGFDIQDTSTGSAFSAGSNDVKIGGHVVVFHHIAAIRNVAHDSGGAGLSAIHADYIRFEGNTVYKNSATSPYGDSGIDLWEAQASDTAPGFHIVIRNNVSYQNAEWNIHNPTDGEGIILDTFDYADPTYGTTPYTTSNPSSRTTCAGATAGAASRSRARARPATSRSATTRCSTTTASSFPWPGAEIVSIGDHNEFYNNIAIVGPDAKDGPNNSGLTTAIQDGCGTQGGVAVTTGSVWEGNIAFSMLTGNRLSNSSCPAPISPTTNKLGVNPALTAPALSATTAQSFGIAASSPAAHAGSATSYAPVRLRLPARATRPSVDRRVRALEAAAGRPGGRMSQRVARMTRRAAHLW